MDACHTSHRETQLFWEFPVKDHGRTTSSIELLVARTGTSVGSRRTCRRSLETGWLLGHMELRGLGFHSHQKRNRLSGRQASPAALAYESEHPAINVPAETSTLITNQLWFYPISGIDIAIRMEPPIECPSDIHPLQENALCLHLTTIVMGNRPAHHGRCDSGSGRGRFGSRLTGKGRGRRSWVRTCGGQLLTGWLGGAGSAAARWAAAQRSGSNSFSRSSGCVGKRSSTSRR